MARILVYVETRNDVVQSVTYELMTAAREMSQDEANEVICCVLTSNAAAIGSQLQGADQILHMSHPSLSPYNPDSHLRGLHAAIEVAKPDLVLLPYSAAGLDLGASASARLALPLVGYCIELQLADGALMATSQVYGGKLVAKTRTALPAIAVVVPGSFQESAGRVVGKGVLTDLAPQADLDRGRINFVSASVPDPNQIDLTKAERIVCVGRGLGSAEKLPVMQGLASALAAEIAGSRPVIDSGWLPKARQVGKSGQKVKPKLYIAAGVSGAPEHLEGMKSSEFIIAVNSDRKAPIFEVAHVGTTCDIFELVPALTKRIQQG
jgi:electron transfer flavoprotein alpha subunit